eukprot:TRINITY_DN6015_c0_g1_i2.p1 TRINITY_DN6015_c0_g1~~TRINITY_DN6015_c0_g1_i2.p1  ORF type:complete len:103 (-),score=12.42 TRINITY_DN6015_c0_g1_i2:57-365(-)
MKKATWPLQAKRHHCLAFFGLASVGTAVGVLCFASLPQKSSMHMQHSHRVRGPKRNENPQAKASSKSSISASAAGSAFLFCLVGATARTNHMNHSPANVSAN